MDSPAMQDDNNELKEALLHDIASKMGIELPESGDPDELAARVLASIDIGNGKYDRTDSITITITGDMSEEEIKQRVEDLNQELSDAGLVADDFIDYKKVMDNLEDGQSTVHITAMSNDNNDLIVFSNYDGEQNISVPPASLDEINLDDLREMHATATEFEKEMMDGSLDHDASATDHSISSITTDYTRSTGNEVTGFIASAMVQEVIKPQEIVPVTNEVVESQPTVTAGPAI